MKIKMRQGIGWRLVESRIGGCLVAVIRNNCSGVARYRCVIDTTGRDTVRVQAERPTAENALNAACDTAALHGMQPLSFNSEWNDTTAAMIAELERARCSKSSKRAITSSEPRHETSPTGTAS